MTRSRSLLVLALLVTVVAASCGSSDETTTSAADGVASSTTASSTTTTTIAETTTITVPETTTSSTLAGTSIDFFPQTGDELVVVGVAHDDVLNVRVGPGIFNDIVDTLDPTGSTTATGKARDLGQAIWVEHDTGDAVGWSNVFFLAFAGATEDATAEIAGELGAGTATSMEELGLIVAATQASQEPSSRIVMSVAPTEETPAEVTIDVIGLGDDSVYGFRLHVFGEIAPEATMSLLAVERTVLCSRGVTSDGLCV